jgi:hypothetical protein
VRRAKGLVQNGFDVFGNGVATIIEEVTDDKALQKEERKERQVREAPYKSPRAKVLKLADKISNFRAIAASPPPAWSVKRRLDYIAWAARVASSAIAPFYLAALPVRPRRLPTMIDPNVRWPIRRHRADFAEFLMRSLQKPNVPLRAFSSSSTNANAKQKRDGQPVAVSLSPFWQGYAMTIISTTALVQESTITMSSPQRKYLMGQPPSTTMISGGRS